MTSDSESEEEKEYQMQENGKRSRGNSDAMEDDEEEKKVSSGDNDLGFGFTNEDVVEKEEEAGNETSDDDEYDNQFEIAVTVDQIKSPLTKLDEFSLFSQAINNLANQRPHDIGFIVSQLTQQQSTQLKTMLQTKRIALSSGDAASGGVGQGAPVEARVIMKARRRTQQQ